MFLLTLFLSTLAAVVTEGAVSPHIIGGEKATHGDHPYICSLQIWTGTRWYHICGSAIWNENYIVTAGHCVDPRETAFYRFVCGIHTLNGNEQYRQSRRVSEVIVHERYGKGDGTYPNDIAVLRLSEPLEQTDYVKAFRFANPNDGDFVDQTCAVTGWGRKDDGKIAETLKKVYMKTISNTKCNETWTNGINDGHVCIFEDGRSSCNGDSGGPQRCGNLIVGLTSWGVSSCSPSHPSVNTRVSFFHEWLVSVTSTQQ